MAEGKPVLPESSAVSSSVTDPESGVLNGELAGHATSSSPSITYGPNKLSSSTFDPKSCSGPQSAVSLQAVKWRIHWQQPVLMIVFALCGTVLAIGHHFYYNSLDGNIVSTAERQQWAIRFGTVFAFVTISFFKVAVTTASTQATWAILRHRSISIKGIDKMFSITSDPISIWSSELVKQAKVLVMLAIIRWCLPLTALIPPATLSITTGVHTETRTFPVPILDWASPGWGPGNATIDGTVKPDAVNPSSLVRKIAWETAEGMAVVPLIAPATNSSFSLQFFGPTLQCNDANSSQQVAFDSYTAAYADPSGTFVCSQLATLNITPPYALVFSAFSSTLFNGDQPFNNINQFPSPYSNLVTPQIWVQTGNRSIVCVLANASFDVGFEFSSGVQNLYQRKIEVINELSVTSTCEGVACIEESSYFANFLAWTNMLNGNVTMYPGYDAWELVEVSSNMLITGLATCDEIANSCWDSIFLQNSPSFHIPNVTDNNFPGALWGCRNHTIDRGIEDLANNITISMLSSPSLTTNKTRTTVTFSTTHNLYQYNSHNLILSYMMAVFATSMAISIGLYSFAVNGVSHSHSFSAIMTTTRNPDLDALSQGQSLGAAPLDRKLGNVRLRFGTIDIKRIEETGKVLRKRTVRHAAFGLEDSVSELRKGDWCT